MCSPKEGEGWGGRQNNCGQNDGRYWDGQRGWERERVIQESPFGRNPNRNSATASRMVFMHFVNLLIFRGRCVTSAFPDASSGEGSLLGVSFLLCGRLTDEFLFRNLSGPRTHSPIFILSAGLITPRGPDCRT